MTKPFLADLKTGMPPSRAGMAPYSVTLPMLMECVTTRFIETNQDTSVADLARWLMWSPAQVLRILKQRDTTLIMLRPRDYSLRGSCDRYGPTRKYLAQLLKKTEHIATAREHVIATARAQARAEERTGNGDCRMARAVRALEEAEAS